MSPADEEKTAFITPYGLYATKSCHSDSKTSAPLLETDDKDLQTSDRPPVEVYIDDIVVKSKNPRGAVLPFTRSFSPLEKYGMKLNPSKCAFGVSAVKFLGFIVSQRRIEVSPNQVKAVMETPPPGARRNYSASRANSSP
ncbi:hypothetical protein CK203_090259 [Vitis vinifera]|uniref:Reverse transcriptase domain-containing protein n=1 Tax=Vitis vinifera TaxID=29760 RepID=A0A438DSE0_VITVI|nr:hypothetical protein CK203_090259 [Vitis vinifera]